MEFLPVLPVSSLALEHQAPLERIPSGGRAADIGCELMPQVTSVLMTRLSSTALRVRAEIAPVITKSSAP